MTGGTEGIAMDTEALTRAASELEDAGGRLTGVAGTAGGVGISPSAFGLMNSYLGGPIHDAAQRTTEMLRTAGEVVTALGAGARAAAADWDTYEDGTAQGFSAAQADLEAARDIL